MSDEQATLQQGLVARYERLRSQKVDPREDNALAITTDGRKLALDARLFAATSEDFPTRKSTPWSPTLPPPGGNRPQHAARR